MPGIDTGGDGLGVWRGGGGRLLGHQSVVSDSTVHHWSFLGLYFSLCYIPFHSNYYILELLYYILF